MSPAQGHYCKATTVSRSWASHALYGFSHSFWLTLSEVFAYPAVNFPLKLPVLFLRAIVRTSEGTYVNMVSSGFVALDCARVLVHKERMDLFRFLLLPVFCVALFHVQANET